MSDRRAGVEHRFGPYGGQYVPETLMPALAELEAAWIAARDDPGYRAELDGAAARLRRAPDAAVPRRAALSEVAGRAIWLKREDLITPARTSSTTRSARRCSPGGWASGGSSPRPAPASTASRPRPPARCSAWSASSTWAPRTCAARRPTSQRMELLGATVVPVDAGARTLKEADLGGDPRLGHERRDHALRDRLGVGPAPYPAIVRDLQRVIGDEARAQLLEREGRLPDRVDRLRRRRLERDRHVRRLRRRRRRARSSASRRPARASRPAATARR